MKKKIKVIIVVLVVLILMLIPIPRDLNDGGSVEYRAILYKVTKIHRLSDSSTDTYEYGWEVKVLGITLYNKVSVDLIVIPSADKVNDRIIEYLEDKDSDISNIAYNYVDSSNSKVVVGLVDNSEEKQNEFMEKVFTGEDYLSLKSVQKFGKIEFRESKDVFEGEIVKAEDNYITVLVLEDSNSFKANDKVTMKVTRPTNGVNDFYVEGNKVRVTFNGFVLHSNPPQIGTIQIELVS